MSTPALVMIVIGIVLIWAAIKDKNPVDEAKRILARGSG